MSWAALELVGSYLAGYTTVHAHPLHGRRLDGEYAVVSASGVGST